MCRSVPSSAYTTTLSAINFTSGLLLSLAMVHTRRYFVRNIWELFVLHHLIRSRDLFGVGCDGPILSPET